MPPALLWMAPALSGGGYASEALTFAKGLLEQLGDGFSMRQFAEPADEAFVQSLRAANSPVFRALRRGASSARSGIAVCHSTPDAWVPSKFPGWDEVAPCPPPNAKFAVGRTMYETDSLPADWVNRCNRMDEVWVPTAFHADTFARAGVVPSKLVVLGEPVDTTFFNPLAVQPLGLPPLHTTAGTSAAPPFRFLSVFKWEARKGWDALLTAYFEEFAAGEPVELVLKTKPFYSSGNFDELISQFVADRRLPASRPTVRVLGSELELTDLPSLYRAASAFVLPSRGEGWGRPHVEAMAMGLPVIATNWSGPTAFLDEEVGFPLRYELEELPPEMNLPGHRWAEPDVAHLRELMRLVYTERDEAARRGRAARERMQKFFSPAALATEVEAQLMRIDETVLAPRRQKQAKKGKHLGDSKDEV